MKIKYCKNCGYETKKLSDKFCFNCGSELIEVDTQSMHSDSMDIYTENQSTDNDENFVNKISQSQDIDKQNTYKNNKKIYIDYFKENRKKVVAFCGLIAMVFVCIFIFYEKKKSNYIGEVCKENVTVLANATRDMYEDRLPKLVIYKFTDLLTFPGCIDDIVEENSGALIKAYNDQLKYNARIEEESENSATIVLFVSNANPREEISSFVALELFNRVMENDAFSNFNEDTEETLRAATKKIVNDCIDSVIEEARKKRQNAKTVNYEIRFRFQRENDKIKYIYDEEELGNLLKALDVKGFYNEFTNFMNTEASNNGEGFKFEFWINEVFDEEKILQEMNNIIPEDILDEEYSGDE